VSYSLQFNSVFNKNNMGGVSWTKEEGWRKIHKKELRNMYSSPCIIRVMKSVRIEWKVREGETHI